MLLPNMGIFLLFYLKNLVELANKLKVNNLTRVTFTLTSRVETHAPIGARLLGIGPGSCHWATGGHIGTIGQTTRVKPIPVYCAPVVGLTPFPLLTNTVPTNAHFLHVVHGLHRYYGLLYYAMPCHMYTQPKKNCQTLH